MTVVDGPGAEVTTALMAAARLAPSPDNNQPWRFRVEGMRVVVAHDEDRALPSDAAMLFSLTALGAATENVVLAAGEFGLAARPRLVSQAVWSEDESRVRDLVEIDLTLGGAADPRAARMATRMTNRRRYARVPPDPVDLDALENAVGDGARVDFVVDRGIIRELSKLVASADRIRFEHRPFHEELHRQLRLTAEEAESTGDGLDVRTLGAPPGTATVLRFLRPWPRARRLNRIGMSRLLAMPSKGLVRASGAVGVLTIRSPGRDDGFEAGRAFQRLWLEADARGLSLHPLGSLPVFLAHLAIEDGRRSGLSRRHLDRIALLGRRLRLAVPAIGDRTVAMLFRLGSAAAPRVRSLRRPLEDIVDGAPGADAPATDRTGRP